MNSENHYDRQENLIARNTSGKFVNTFVRMMNEKCGKIDEMPSGGCGRIASRLLSFNFLNGYFQFNISNLIFVCNVLSITSFYFLTTLLKRLFMTIIILDFSLQVQVKITLSLKYLRLASKCKSKNIGCDNHNEILDSQLRTDKAQKGTI